MTHDPHYCPRQSYWVILPEFGTKKSSQQNPERFHLLGMAKKSPNFGDLPFVQLTMTHTTANIIEVAVESRFLPPSLWLWAVPVLAHWRCELAQPHFFAVRLRVR